MDKFVAEDKRLSLYNGTRLLGCPSCPSCPKSLSIVQTLVNIEVSADLGQADKNKPIEVFI